MRRYAATIAMLSSILALAFIKEVPVWIRIILVIIGAIGAADQLREDFRINNENIKICKNQSEIEDAMKDIIRVQGKICIMSRDLSWVNEEIKTMIKKKRNSVRVFAQAESQLTKELKEYGTEIYYYGGYHFEPKTRFTIIRYNRNDPQVAIAETSSALRKRSFRHKIYETNNVTLQDKFICSLSLDLMEMCKLASEREKQWQKERETQAEREKND